MLPSATQASLSDDGQGEISEQEFKEIAREKTDSQLINKIALGDFICKCLNGDADPRAAIAINRMRREQQWLMDIQAERSRARREAAGEPEPESIVIQLQPLKLSGKVKGINQ